MSTHKELPAKPGPVHPLEEALPEQETREGEDRTAVDTSRVSELRHEQRPAENGIFASYATGSAFRIDLSKRMVVALMSAARGRTLDTGHFGVTGLVQRGLAELVEPQPRCIFREMRLTEAGHKVADLCRMAGLDKENPAPAGE